MYPEERPRESSVKVFVIRAWEWFLENVLKIGSVPP